MSDEERVKEIFRRTFKRAMDKREKQLMDGDERIEIDAVKQGMDEYERSELDAAQNRRYALDHPVETMQSNYNNLEKRGVDRRYYYNTTPTLNDAWRISPFGVGITGLRNWLSPRLMEGIDNVGLQNGSFIDGFLNYSPDNYVQNSFLMDRDSQREYLLNHGFKLGDKKDVPLISKSIGNYPVYKVKSYVDRNQLKVLGNNSFDPFNAPTTRSNHLLFTNVAARDPGNAPTTEYLDKDGNIYQMLNDLNDYGGGSGGRTVGLAGKLLDLVGSPIGVSTGIQPLFIFDKQKGENLPLNVEDFYYQQNTPQQQFHLEDKWFADRYNQRPYRRKKLLIKK